ncbi:MAG TPA: WHG domain-containing protein [Acidimicrobiales bacterium]|nr:WHG domain-containing protein [Acidimicrobiales bacterium]
MSPKTADPAVRTALIEHAARLIAEEGREALTLRRLAAEVGASTMVVYTHFDGMDDLRRAVRAEGFDRLAHHLGGVEATDDPVADIIVLGWAYHVNATTNPNLYRVMFMERVVDDVPGGIDHADRIDHSTFAMLVNGVARCLEAGRFHPAEPLALANQLWAVSHGVAALELAGILDPDEAVDCLEASGANLLSGFGDEGDQLSASVDRARSRMSLR